MLVGCAHCHRHRRERPPIGFPHALRFQQLPFRLTLCQKAPTRYTYFGTLIRKVDPCSMLLKINRLRRNPSRGEPLMCFRSHSICAEQPIFANNLRLYSCSEAPALSNSSWNTISRCPGGQRTEKFCFAIEIRQSRHAFHLGASTRCSPRCLPAVQSGANFTLNA
jgi:hypothetical protein